MTKTSLFEEVVLITEPYLGPSAYRFISRQVAFHLNKPPERLEVSDLPKLAEWVVATLSMLTEEQEDLSDYSHKIQILSNRT